MDGPVAYASRGTRSVAYRAASPVADGHVRPPLLFMPGVISHVEVLLEEPGIRRLFERFGGFSRLLLMDRVGTGLSDPLDGDVTLEDEVEDVIAVLDAAGVERAALMAYTTSSPLAVQAALTHPERVRALILYAGVHRTLADENYDWASEPEERRVRQEALLSRWGTGANLDHLAPSRADDVALRDWLGRLERSSTSPGGMRRLTENLQNVDVRHLLPELRVPTLILHRRDDTLIDVRHSRYAAERIPGARYVELEGRDSLPSAGDTDAFVGEIEEFLTGSRTGHPPQREMLTILFTDVVGATGHAARLGDGAWRDKLAAHDETIRSVLPRFGGVEIKTVGDAFLASFSGAPSDAVRCARALLSAVHPLGLTLRIGLHTGECERMGDDVGGMAVHIAARIVGLAGPEEVLVSGTTYGTVVGSGLAFTHRGTQALRGVPGEWPLFTLD